jgi:hypothetical protein
VGVLNVKTTQDAIYLKVSNFKDLEVIINHFDKYPLISQKLGDYELFKQAFFIVKNKEHLTLEGIQRLVGIKAGINRGLTSDFQEAFPDLVSVNRPLIINQKIQDPF